MWCIVAALLIYGIDQIFFERQEPSPAAKRARREVAATSEPSQPQRTSADGGRTGQVLPSPARIANIHSAPATPSLSAPSSARVGDHVTIAVNVESKSAGIASAAFEFDFDRSKLRLLSVTAGDLMMQAGATSKFTYEAARGGDHVHATLTADSGDGATGSGSVALMEFEALTDGPAVASLRSFEATDRAGNTIPIGNSEHGTVTLSVDPS
jgi:hypothetical protein